MAYRDESLDGEKHIISILLENEAGALSGVAGLFSARGYNIESLTVSKTDDPTLSRMTIVTLGSGDKVDQIISQLNKLVMVVEVKDLIRSDYVEREMILVKLVSANGDNGKLNQLASEYGANLVRHREDVCLLELMTNGDRGNDFIQALSDWKIVEVVRSGTISLEV